MKSVNFKGTTRECLIHQGKQPTKLLFLKNAIKFTGASRSSVDRWLSESWGNLPHGINLIRVQYLLEIVGYEVEELKNLNDNIYKLGKLLALRIADVDQVAQEVFGFSDLTYLYRTLRGNRGISGVDSVAISDLLLEKKDEIDKAVSHWRKELGITSGDPQKSEVSAVGKEGVLDKDQVIKSLAHMIQSMQPLAEAIASDDFTPEDRETLRDLAGRFGVFNLKNALVKLCGERARNTQNGNTQERTPNV